MWCVPRVVWCGVCEVCVVAWSWIPRVAKEWKDIVWPGPHFRRGVTFSLLASVRNALTQGRPVRNRFFKWTKLNILTRPKSISVRAKLYFDLSQFFFDTSNIDFYTCEIIFWHVRQYILYVRNYILTCPNSFLTRPISISVRAPRLKSKFCTCRNYFLTGPKLYFGTCKIRFWHGFDRSKIIFLTRPRSTFVRAKFYFETSKIRDRDEIGTAHH